jgi:hypothetical protein
VRKKEREGGREKEWKRERERERERKKREREKERKREQETVKEHGKHHEIDWSISQSNRFTCWVPRDVVFGGELGAQVVVTVGVAGGGRRIVPLQHSFGRI